MKPGDHPEFFRLPAPAGRSRESTIVLDGQGTFHHDGVPIGRSSMAETFFKWIRRHPDDGRFILSNGYDWTYLTVVDVPFFVRSVALDEQCAIIGLSDGSRERLRPEGLRIGKGDAVYCRVKDGQYEARFTPAAQLALAPFLEEADGRCYLRLGQNRVPMTSS